MKFVSRAAWGARGYRLPSGATLYSRARRGVKLHYLGTAYSDRAHDRCDDYIRQIQAQHMDGNGWSDIGYSFLVCTHGYVYEGRGLRRRNSANGGTALNEECYAVCLLVGSSGLTKPTTAQLHGARDAIDYCRAEGPAGTWIGGHRDGYATTCPGEPIYAWVKAGAPRPASTTTPAPSEEDDMALSDDDKKWIVSTIRAEVGRATAAWKNLDIDPRDIFQIQRDAANFSKQAADQTKGLSSTGLTEAQLDALADKVADKLAARLAE